MTLQDTPSANRLHIGIFGKTNSGKSSFLNAFTGQQISIVSDIAGTTTDPVYKAMEVAPMGPCVLIDTAGFDDETDLGAKRMEKTALALDKTEVAVLLLDAGEVWTALGGDPRKQELTDVAEAANEKSRTFKETLATEIAWYQKCKEKNIPILLILNKVDLLTTGELACADSSVEKAVDEVKKLFGTAPMCLSTVADTFAADVLVADASPVDTPAATRETLDFSITPIKEALARLIPENYGTDTITRGLVEDGDLVLLIMPQDIQAPKGRLILPQVQTLRELLDKKCIVLSATTDRMVEALKALGRPPKLIITDSQVFSYVYEHKPKESMLTSFSVLFAAYKGDLPYYVDGAKHIDQLQDGDKILIAECCTHAPLQEDIGRVKLPRLLKKRIGEHLEITHVSGTDFPTDVSGYDLIIQCGGCMFNRQYILSRIGRAKEQKVPMTNYGVAIAHLSGILDNISY